MMVFDASDPLNVMYGLSAGTTIFSLQLHANQKFRYGDIVENVIENITDKQTCILRP